MFILSSPFFHFSNYLLSLFFPFFPFLFGYSFNSSSSCSLSFSFNVHFPRFFSSSVSLPSSYSPPLLISYSSSLSPFFLPLIPLPPSSPWVGGGMMGGMGGGTSIHPSKGTRHFSSYLCQLCFFLSLFMIYFCYFVILLVVFSLFLFMIFLYYVFFCLTFFLFLSLFMFFCIIIFQFFLFLFLSSFVDFCIFFLICSCFLASPQCLHLLYFFVLYFCSSSPFFFTMFP